MNLSTSKISKVQKSGGPQQITNQIATIFNSYDSGIVANRITHDKLAQKETELLIASFKATTEWNEQVSIIKKTMSFVKGGIYNFPSFSSKVPLLLELMSPCILNLRSTVVKYICLLIVQLAHSLGPKFDSSVELLIPILFQPTTNGTQMISQSCRNTILHIFQCCFSKRVFGPLNEQVLSKSQVRRNIAAECLEIITSQWPQTQIIQNYENIQNNISILLSDAGQEARKIAKSASINLSKIPNPNRQESQQTETKNILFNQDMNISIISDVGTFLKSQDNSSKIFEKSQNNQKIENPDFSNLKPLEKAEKLVFTTNEKDSFLQKQDFQAKYSQDFSKELSKDSSISESKIQNNIQSFSSLIKPQARLSLTCVPIYTQGREKEFLDQVRLLLARKDSVALEESAMEIADGMLNCVKSESCPISTFYQLEELLPLIPQGFRNKSEALVDSLLQKINPKTTVGISSLLRNIATLFSSYSLVLHTLDNNLPSLPLIHFISASVRKDETLLNFQEISEKILNLCSLVLIDSPNNPATVISSLILKVYTKNKAAYTSFLSKAQVDQCNAILNYIPNEKLSNRQMRTSNRPKSQSISLNDDLTSRIIAQKPEKSNEFNTINSNTINSNTINSNTINSNTLNSNTLNSNTLNSNTLNSNTLNSNTNNKNPPKNFDFNFKTDNKIENTNTTINNIATITNITNNESDIKSFQEKTEITEKDFDKLSFNNNINNKVKSIVEEEGEDHDESLTSILDEIKSDKEKFNSIEQLQNYFENNNWLHWEESLSALAFLLNSPYYEETRKLLAMMVQKNKKPQSILQETLKLVSQGGRNEIDLLTVFIRALNPRIINPCINEICSILSSKVNHSDIFIRKSSILCYVELQIIGINIEPYLNDLPIKIHHIIDHYIQEKRNVFQSL